MCLLHCLYAYKTCENMLTLTLPHSLLQYCRTHTFAFLQRHIVNSKESEQHHSTRCPMGSDSFEFAAHTQQSSPIYHLRSVLYFNVLLMRDAPSVPAIPVWVHCALSNSILCICCDLRTYLPINGMDVQAVYFHMHPMFAVTLTQ